MPGDISYKTDMSNVDWSEMKSTLVEDNFDNGRTPEQLRISFENSYLSVVAYDGNRIIGTARVLSTAFATPTWWTCGPSPHTAIVE